MAEDEHTFEEKLDKLTEEIRRGETRVLDLFRTGEKEDYFSLVTQSRLFQRLANDKSILEALLLEINHELLGIDRVMGEEWIEEGLIEKDGHRRFAKSSELLAPRYRHSLLSGKTFEECLAQYKELIGHVEGLWHSACQSYQMAAFPICAFLSILVIEEIGKLTNVFSDLVFFDVPKSVSVDRDHKRKHFVGVVSGALINNRLDRVLGRDIVVDFLHQAEAGSLEKVRQSCLYIDMRDQSVTIPKNVISKEMAQNLAVLSGELMAETLGHAPWDFERMLDAVIAFEIEIGIDEERVRK